MAAVGGVTDPDAVAVRMEEPGDELETGYHRLRLGRVALAEHTYFVTLCCAQRHPLLSSELVKGVTVEALQGLLVRGVKRLDAYVLMPDHMLMVMALDGEGDLVGVLREFKKYTGRKSNQVLGRIGPFWQDGYYEHAVRSEPEWRGICQYVLSNPVRAGLCQNWREYLWAGYRPWDEDGSRGQ